MTTTGTGRCGSTLTSSQGRTVINVCDRPTGHGGDHQQHHPEGGVAIWHAGPSGSTPDPAVALLAELRRESWHTDASAIYTSQALVSAAELLADLYSAGDQHGVAASDWAECANLPAAAVSVVGRRLRASAPTQTDRCERLTTQLADALVEAGITARLVPAPLDTAGGSGVHVDRRATSPAWGPDGTFGLWLACTPWDGFVGGWLAAIDIARAAPAQDLIASYDQDGIDAITETLDQLLAGQFGNPFRFR